jgi:hypothetical protein
VVMSKRPPVRVINPAAKEIAAVIAREVRARCGANASLMPRHTGRWCALRHDQDRIRLVRDPDDIGRPAAPRYFRSPRPRRVAFHHVA